MKPEPELDPNQTLIHLPVYEPAGRDIRMDASEWQQHVLLLGATGCGKSTLMRRMMAQLVARPDTGLLIFDAKQDDTVEWVARWAAQHRRELAVLGTRGTHYLDLFGRLRSLADVEAMVKRMLAGTQNMGRDNEFWNEMRESMVDALLTLLAAGPLPVEYEAAMALMSEFFFQPPPWKRVDQQRRRIRQLLAQGPPAAGRKLQQALDLVNLWQTMEGRTRDNVRSTLVNAVRPFASLPAADCFEPRARPALAMEQLVQQGGLCVVSLNALAEPALAGLFFRLAKHDFTLAVQQRPEGTGRLCGIFADELPLVATAEDVELLATVRSRRCFVCAATQGLSALDEKIGLRRRKALMANFGTLIFMRGREEETDQAAAVALGQVESVEPAPRGRDEGGLLAFEPERVRRTRLVCPPGTLGRLSPHQGYLVRPGPECSAAPLWFVPCYEDAAGFPPPRPQLRPAQPVNPAGSGQLPAHLHALGHSRQLDVSQWQAALRLVSRRPDHPAALAAATGFFRARAQLVPLGLALLPLPWLKALPGILWSLRQPHWTRLPYLIREVLVADALLQFRFAGEPQRDGADPRLGEFDRLRVAVNTRLYPSCYRRLKPRHAAALGLAPAEPGPGEGA